MLLFRGDSAVRFVWATVIDGDSDVYFHGAVVLRDGNLLALCRARGTVVAGSDTVVSRGQTDMALVRISSDRGNLLGARMVGTTGSEYAFSLNPMPDGGFLFGGMFAGTMDFGGLVRYHDRLRGFIVRRAPDLTPTWAVTDSVWSSASPPDDRNPPFDVDAKGNTFVRRTRSIRCISPEGAVLWEEPIAIGEYHIRSMGAGGRAQLAVAGEFDRVAGAPLDYPWGRWTSERDTCCGPLRIRVRRWGLPRLHVPRAAERRRHGAHPPGRALGARRARRRAPEVAPLRDRSRCYVPRRARGRRGRCRGTHRFSRRVARRVDRCLEAGRHRIAWNPRGRDAPAGVYFVRVRAGARSEVRKLVRLRESSR